jgi:hypothetical protein
MRLREFYALLDAVFGPEYARTLSRELVITGLDSRTADQALDDDVDPRDVWHALCDAMDIPQSRRDGGDRTRMIPPPR